MGPSRSALTVPPAFDGGASAERCGLGRRFDDPSLRLRVGRIADPASRGCGSRAAASRGAVARGTPSRTLGSRFGLGAATDGTPRFSLAARAAAPRADGPFGAFFCVPRRYSPFFSAAVFFGGVVTPARRPCSQRRARRLPTRRHAGVLPDVATQTARGTERWFRTAAVGRCLRCVQRCQ